MSESPDCPGCGYPLLSTPCSECARIKAQDAARERRLAVAFGGVVARDSFTVEKFDRTPANSKVLEGVQGFNPKKSNIYLHGPAGVGKTHLAVALTRRFWQGRDGYTVVWKMTQVNRSVRCADSAADESSKIRRLIDQRVLVLDDLGTEKLTEFTHGLLYEIIDGRYMAGRGGLAITSNLSLDELAERLKDDRIPSRLAGMCAVFDLKGERDRRMVA